MLHPNGIIPIFTISVVVEYTHFHWAIWGTLGYRPSFAHAKRNHPVLKGIDTFVSCWPWNKIPSNWRIQTNFQTSPWVLVMIFVWRSTQSSEESGKIPRPSASVERRVQTRGLARGWLGGKWGTTWGASSHLSWPIYTPRCKMLIKHNKTKYCK